MNLFGIPSPLPSLAATASVPSAAAEWADGKGVRYVMGFPFVVTFTATKTRGGWQFAFHLALA
jgi:hypothetical protein